MEALEISVAAANITGKLTASQINADGISASNVTISGAITATSGSMENMTITGKLTFGGNSSYYINANYNDGSYYINLPGFRVDDASGAVFSGKLSAASGSFSGTITSASATITGGSLKIGSNSTYVNIDSSGIITIDGEWSAHEENQTMLLMKFHSVFGDLCGLYVSGYVDEDMKFTPTNVFARRIG